MKPQAALQKWAMAKAYETLSHFNELQLRRGKPLDELDESSVVYNLLLAEEVRCCDGHSPDECPSSIAARPVLRVSARTIGGQVLWTESHVGDFRLEELLESIIEAAGEPLTL